MNKRLLALAAAALIAIGAFGDHLLNDSQSSPAIAAPPASSSSNSLTSIAASSSNSTSTTLDQAIEQVYKAVNPSVVYVVNQGVGSGSGVIYDSRGDIVTNYHVISGATSLSVTLSDGRTFTASLVGTDRADDLAVIHISASGLTPARFATAGSYQVAQTVIAIGNPLGLKGSVTSGLISGLNRSEQEPNGAYIANAVQTSAAINPGNSGGALVSLNGTVVGIPTLEQTSTSDGTSAQAVGFAVPAERVTYIANQIIVSGKVQHTGRPYLGIAPTDASNQQNGFGLGQTTVTSGALVNQMASGGPASKSGVQQGDVITAIDGTPVTDAQDLLTVLATKKPGDTVTLKINRNGSSVTAQVRLGELPA